MTRRLLPVAAGLVVAALAFAAVVLATDDDERAGEADSPAASPASLATGRDAFARMGCGSCHRFAAAGSEGQIGPDLDAALAEHSRDSIVATVVSPPPSIMPRDFGARMSRAELVALADFLLAERR